MASDPRKPARALNGAERALAAPLAAWLLFEMDWRLRDCSPSDDLLWDNAQSNLETACDALARVGLMRAEGGYWRVLRPATTVLALPDATTRRDLDALLNAMACHAPYVDALCPVGDPILPDTPSLTTVCEGLIACGYMEAETVPKAWTLGQPHDVLHWTPKFDPWLVFHGAVSLKMITPAHAAAVDAVLAKLPDAAVFHLSGRICNHPPEFIRYFTGQWTGGKWRAAVDANRDRDAGIPESAWDLGLISGLYARLHG